MKQVNFKKLILRNFLSIGEIPLEINFKSGLNLITGINLDKEGSRNGCGKSSICDGVFFALFGETIRELKKEEIVNNINKKNCETTIYFEIVDQNQTTNYVIQRSLLPTKLKLFKDDVDITKSSIVQTTNEICKIISSTPEVFQNSIIMTVNNTLPFMAQKKVDKRKFIEGILKLSIFGDLLLRARQLYNDCKHNIEIEHSKIKEIEKSCKVFQDQQSSAKQQKEEKIKNLQLRLNETEQIIKTHETTIQNHNDYSKQFQTNQTNIDFLKKKETEYAADETILIKEIANQKALITLNENRLKEIDSLKDICLVCKRPIKEQDKHVIETEKNAVNNQINDLKNHINENDAKIKLIKTKHEKCKQGISLLGDKNHEIELYLKEQENLQDKIAHYNNTKTQILKDIENIQNEQDSFNDVINETQDKINKLNEQLKAYKNKAALLDIVKFIFSEEGVKSYIVKKILKILNGKLAFYLKKLDANCFCLFNEYFEEFISNEKQQVCSYHNFSGGERKRIDLAMLLTFIDIRKLQSNVITNLSFYDEILDTSLDEKGVNSLLKILNERITKNKECTYIISHNPNVINLPIDEIIYLEKKNGFTLISNYNNIDNKEK